MHIVRRVNWLQSSDMKYVNFLPARSISIHKVFNPDKLNYGMYGDTGHHLHMHLVPKYRDEFEWGGTFAMDPNIKKLDEAQCEEVAAKLRAEIKGA